MRNHWLEKANSLIVSAIVPTGARGAAMLVACAALAACSSSSHDPSAPSAGGASASAVADKTEGARGAGSARPIEELGRASHGTGPFEGEEREARRMVGVAAPAGPGGVRPLISTPTTYPTYHGGPVLSSPQIYSIYWGTFSGEQVSTMQTYLLGLAGYLSGSGSERPTVRQYGVKSASLSGVYSDPSLPTSSVTRDSIPQHITALQNAGAIPSPSSQTVYMVFTSGIKFSDDYGVYPGGWCGYHSNSGALQWAVNPYPASSHCGQGGWSGVSELGWWQSVTSHEVQEAATDPQPTSWSAWTPEIGDQCNGLADSGNVTAMSFGAVQTVVDSRLSACTSFSPACGTPGFSNPACAYIYPSPDAIWLTQNDSPGVDVNVVTLNQWAGPEGPNSQITPINVAVTELPAGVGAIRLNTYGTNVNFAASMYAAVGSSLVTITGSGVDAQGLPETHTAKLQINVLPCQESANTCGQPGGAQCGTISLGCNATANCGSCPSGYTCTANQCAPTRPACVPLTCAPSSAYPSGLCGRQSDGCGGYISCSTKCPGGTICDLGICSQPCGPAQDCPFGYSWSDAYCDCEQDLVNGCACGGKYPKCKVCQ